MTKTKKKSFKREYPLRSADVPATKGMLDETRDELKNFVRSEISGVKSEIHRLGGLIEEQNARNIVVLDAFEYLSARMEKSL